MHTSATGFRGNCMANVVKPRRGVQSRLPYKPLEGVSERVWVNQEPVAPFADHRDRLADLIYRITPLRDLIATTLELLSPVLPQPNQCEFGELYLAPGPLGLERCEAEGYDEIYLRGARQAFDGFRTGEPRLGEGEKRGPRFWQTLPGILTGVAAIITAVTGLLLAFGQWGVDGSGSDGEPVPGTVPTTSLASEGAPPVTADAIAGTWSGEASKRPGGPFEVRLQIQEGCVLDERCGSITVSNGPCIGDLYFHSVSGGRYEFSVNNFSRPRKKCSPGAGEYLTPRDDGRLLYTTSYDESIRGILHKRP